MIFLYQSDDLTVVYNYTVVEHCNILFNKNNDKTVFRH